MSLQAGRTVRIGLVAKQRGVHPCFACSFQGCVYAQKLRLLYSNSIRKHSLLTFTNLFLTIIQDCKGYVSASGGFLPRNSQLVLKTQ